MDATEIKNTMESIRKTMKSEAESLKNLVDEVTLEKIKHTHTMEESFFKMLKAQETTYDDYIAYLEKMTDEFQEYLSLTNKKLLFSEILKIQVIPGTTKPVLPVFTTGQFNKDDVAKLLGRVNIPNTEPEKRRIKPMESVSTHMKFREKEMKQNMEKSGVKQTLSLSSSVRKVSKYTAPGVDSACHVSADRSGRLWVSSRRGDLVQTDPQGNLLQKIETSGGYYGTHTVTQDGCLFFLHREKSMIYRATLDTNITEFTNTRDWMPLSIHFSRINGDILVGVKRDREAKVTRYNKMGKEIQNIQRDNKGQDLYRGPWYITENINGDICTSDGDKQAVLVVNKSGKHKFSYTGQRSEFHPWGICTDVLGHILVCDSFINAVNLLNQDGGFLTILLSEQQGLRRPRGVCVDDENNLCVGQGLTNIVTVYKYLQ